MNLYLILSFCLGFIAAILVMFICALIHEVISKINIKEQIIAYEDTRITIRIKDNGKLDISTSKFESMPDIINDYADKIKSLEKIGK